MYNGNTNAKEEFLAHTSTLPKVIAATVSVEKYGSFFLQESFDTPSG